MTRTMKNSKMINKRIPLKRPQRGKEQKHGGAYPAGENYTAKEGRRLVPLPRRLPHQDLLFTAPRAGGRCGVRHRR
jgi:hypothetical protein